MAGASDQPLALVLSGGGARGAYEAGVLRYALGKLARRMGGSALPRIFCGTSVGAINACALAARAELPDLGARLLAERWESLRVEDVFRLGWGDLTSIARWLLGKPAAGGVTSLLDAAPLAELVRGFIPWRALHQNVADGRVQAMTLSATDVETGHTMVLDRDKALRERPRGPKASLAVRDGDDRREIRLGLSAGARGLESRDLTIG